MQRRITGTLGNLSRYPGGNKRYHRMELESPTDDTYTPIWRKGQKREKLGNEGEKNRKKQCCRKIRTSGTWEGLEPIGRFEYTTTRK